MAAFRTAAAMGAEAVELDVRRTSDGVLVVHHDPLLADGRQISLFSHADLLSGVDGASLATLDEALDACAGMWVNVEIKNDPSEPDFDPTDSIADQTIVALTERHSDGLWLISSFREETVDRCRALAPTIATAWLCVEITEGTVRRLVSKGHTAVHPWVRTLTEAQVAEAHAHGLQVNTWTCDDPQRMRELIEWGVDGICTNVPDVALSVRAGADAPA